MGVEPEELREVFSTASAPAAALAFKATVDLDLEVLFDDSAAAAHGRDPTSDRAAQLTRDGVPVVDSFAVGPPEADWLLRFPPAPYGRTFPTWALVVLTSVLVIVPLAFTSARKLPAPTVAET